MKTLYPALICALLTACPVYLWGASKDFGEGLANASAPRLLTNANQQHNHWSGIGRIRNDKALCNATLLDTRDEQGTSGPAYIITSSHCIHRVSGAVIKDQVLKGHISFNYFDDTLEQLKTYPLKTLKWGSSHGVDLALIELDIPLSALISNGIEPMKLAEDLPDEARPILALIVPEWNTLHLSACLQQASQEVVEQPFVWRVTMKNQCKGVQSGAFGAPLVDRATNTLFGILSSTTIGQAAAKKCQRDAPCEVRDGKASWHADSNYGSPVVFLKHCFVEGVLTDNEQTCNLYPATSITFSSHEPLQQYFVKRPGDKGWNITPSWNLEFTTTSRLYRYKAVRRASECENPVHYSPPINSHNASIKDPIGPQTGMHLLCILGVESDQAVSNSAMRNALTLAVELAEPAATRAPDVSIVLDRQFLQRYTVIWNLAPPFISRYTYKFGPAQRTDCLAPEGYRTLPPKHSDTEESDDAEDLFGMPPLDQAPDAPHQKFAQIISTHNQPIKICTYAFDQAGRPSDLRVDRLKPR
ncbi:serine protease [Pseudomonas fluorescens]|uniref:serine protease n=1 Tax=Pseudomonas fluorescens TaxID=294 RepID=UPI00125257EF|nr:serine protease [Pseudomonas fluorescens]VVO03544.1 hypothetical protein PS720_02842 [Pseudomonas fluorescens]